MNVLTKKDIMIWLKSIKHTIISYFFWVSYRLFELTYAHLD